MPITVTATYSTERTTIPNTGINKNFTLSSISPNFKTYINQDNWGSFKITKASISLKVDNYLERTNIKFNFALNNTSGSGEVSPGDDQTLTVSMNTSGYLLQAILEAKSLNIQAKRVSGSGTEGNSSGSIRNNAVLSVTFEEPEQFTKCTTPNNVTISPEDVAPNKSATLKWDASTAKGSGHSVSGYHVYECDTSEGNYYQITSNVVTSPHTLEGKSEDENGKTYYYKVKAISNQDSSYDSDLSDCTSLKTVYSDASITFFKFAEKTDIIYIGGTSAIVAAKWGGSGGDNNSITKYIIKNSTTDTEIYNGTDTSEDITVSSGNSYKIKAEAEYKSTNFGNTIQVEQISRSTNAIISSLPKAGTIDTRSIELSWIAPTFIGKKDSSDITYKLTYACGTNTGDLTADTFTNTSQTITLPNSIVAGQETTVYLTYTVEAADSGSRSWTQEIGKYTLEGGPNPPTITGFYDINGPISMQSGIQRKGYKNVKIIFTPASQNTNTGSGTITKYVLRYWKNQEAYKQEDLQGTPIISTTLEKNLETDFSIEEGNSISLQIGACDSYGSWAYSNIVTMDRIKAPTFTWGNISIAKSYSNASSNNTSRVINTISGQVDGAIANINGSTKVFYNITLKYQNINSSIKTNNIEFTNEIASEKYELVSNFPLSTDTDAFSKALYNEVVTKKNPRPTGTLSLQCYYDGFSSYTWTTTKTFTFDYTKELDSLTSSIYSIGYLRSSYANPFEEYSISFKELQCYGPSGESNITMNDQGGTIIKTITKNNQALSIDTVTNPNDDYINKITDKYNLYSQSNLIIPYTLTYTLKYNDEVKDSKSITINVQIYRWYDKDSHVLTNIKLSDSKVLSGDIILPATLCSNSGSNLNTVNKMKDIYYRIVNLETDSAIIDWTQITSAEQDTLRINFSTTDFSLQTFTLQAEIRYTNTNTNTDYNQIIAKTNTFVNRGQTATLALRKSYLGVNVNKEYQTSDLSETPTLQINQHNEGTAEVVQIDATSGASNYITLKTGAQLIGSIGKMANSNYLLITGGVKIVNTEIPVNQTSNIYTLTDPDITTRTIQEIIPSPTISTELLKAFQKANFIGGTQTEGSCEIICHGIKPTDSIPIQLMIRGG